MSNAYCDHLGIAPPSLLGLALSSRCNYLDVLVVALLEHGAPLTLDEVVAAVVPLTTDTPEGLRVSLQKAWAGRAPVVKGPDGRFTLDLESRHLRTILVRLGLRARPAPPAPPVFVPPGPEVPLTMDELKACFWRGCPAGISGGRMAAAVLDVLDRPMRPEEITAIVQAWTAARLPRAQPGHYQPKKSLVVRGEDGCLRMDRTRTDELHSMRGKVRELGLPRTRAAAYVAWHRQHVEERTREEALRLAAMPVVPPVPRNSKVSWHGSVVSVQPRVRLTRSFDQRSHSYLGYVIRIQGEIGGEGRDFLVAVGKAAHEKHQFRVGDEVSGEGVRVEDTDLETADLYKVSGLVVRARGSAERSGAPPFTGVPPPLEEYRARGHRRLAALTYAAKCGSCLWGCEMAVEMIIDPWNPSKRRYRRETFCYGPKSCPMYAAGPTRKVPGRKGMSWTEEDWVDDDATGHRGPDE